MAKLPDQDPYTPEDKKLIALFIIGLSSFVPFTSVLLAVATNQNRAIGNAEHDTTRPALHSDAEILGLFILDALRFPLLLTTAWWAYLVIGAITGTIAVNGLLNIKLPPGQV